MSPKGSSSTKLSDLKQGKLSFGVKRATTANAKTVKTSSTKPVTQRKTSQGSNESSAIDVDSFDEFATDGSDNESEDAIESASTSDEKGKAARATTLEPRPSTTKPSVKTAPPQKIVQEKKKGKDVGLGGTMLRESNNQDKAPIPANINVSGLKDLNPKDPKWNKIYKDTKQKMGGPKTIHGENQTRIHDILRIFDLNDEFGPCVGVPRLERWERAKALGLNPPQEIFDILNTKQGVSQAELSQSVFYGEVV